MQMSEELNIDVPAQTEKKLESGRKLKRKSRKEGLGEATPKALVDGEKLVKKMSSPLTLSPNSSSNGPTKKASSLSDGMIQRIEMGFFCHGFFVSSMRWNHFLAFFAIFSV